MSRYQQTPSSLDSSLGEMEISPNRNPSTERAKFLPELLIAAVLLAGCSKNAVTTKSVVSPSSGPATPSLVFFPKSLSTEQIWAKNVLKAEGEEFLYDHSSFLVETSRASSPALFPIKLRSGKEIEISCYGLTVTPLTDSVDPNNQGAFRITGFSPGATEWKMVGKKGHEKEEKHFVSYPDRVIDFVIKVKDIKGNPTIEEQKGYLFREHDVQGNKLSDEQRNFVEGLQLTRGNRRSEIFNLYNASSPKGIPIPFDEDLFDANGELIPVRDRIWAEQAGLNLFDNLLDRGQIKPDATITFKVEPMGGGFTKQQIDSKGTDLYTKTRQRHWVLKVEITGQPYELKFWESNGSIPKYEIMTSNAPFKKNDLPEMY